MYNVNRRTLFPLLCLSGVVACNSSASGAAATAARSDTGQAAHSAGAPAAGAKGSQTITLAESDVGTVSRGNIEEGAPITGDLRPIESIDVRARIEGDLVGVFVREGERVREGQLLARFDAGDEETTARSAEADSVAAQTNLATAQWNLEQSKELFGAGAISERDYRLAEQNVAGAKAQLAAARARLRSTSNVLRDTRVLAPANGVIGQRLVENGEHLARGAEMFTLIRNEVLELAAAVPARLANSVRTGQVAHFTADGRTFQGRVARVSPTIDPSTRAVTVYVQVPNRDGSIKGGTFATGRVVSRVVSGATLVPSSAIRQSQDNGVPFVYRIAGNKLDIAQVQLGIIDDHAGSAQVLGGLSAGDRVIVGIVGNLGRGMTVQILGTESGAGAQRASP